MQNTGQTPLCRVACKFTGSSSHFSVHDCIASLSYPQLNVFHSARISRPWGKPINGMMGKHERSAHCKSHICSCHQCRGLDVSRCPHMAWDSPMTSRNRERAETPFHSPKVSAKGLRVYTGGGPGLQSSLCAQGIKYLQQFRYPAFGKYTSERHL